MATHNAWSAVGAVPPSASSLQGSCLDGQRRDLASKVVVPEIAAFGPSGGAAEDRQVRHQPTSSDRSGFPNRGWCRDTLFPVGDGIGVGRRNELDLVLQLIRVVEADLVGEVVAIAWALDRLAVITLERGCMGKAQDDVEARLVHAAPVHADVKGFGALDLRSDMQVACSTTR